MFEALITSLGLVALAEIGDKTQLLSFALAARYRRPGPIIAGILVATLANHALAASVGVVLAQWIDASVLRWIVGLLFAAFALWTLVPDKLDGDSVQTSSAGVFMTALTAFFIAEMGDKTQLATVALGARFAQPVTVTLGTTIGMLVANIPAVWIGERLATRLPFKAIRVAAAMLFLVTALVTLFGETLLRAT